MLAYERRINTASEKKTSGSPVGLIVRICYRSLARC